MGLDDLKRKIEKEEKWKENEELRKREEEARRYSEIAKRAKIDLPHLQALEESFWEFAEKFSNIISKQISCYCKRKKILGLFSKSSIATKDSYGKKRPCYPELSVSFDEPKQSVNSITLVAEKGVLYFKGSHFHVNRYSDGVSSVAKYAEHKSTMSLNGFAKSAAIKWLEDQFVTYYDEYTNQ